MPSKKRDYSSEYRNFHSRPEEIAKRSSRNSARAKLEKTGVNVRGKDVDHKSGNPLNNSRSNLRAVSPATNRSFPRNSKAGKK